MSMLSPNSLVSVVWNAVDCAANGGVARPKEWTMRTRLASAPAAELVMSATRTSPTDKLPQVGIRRQDRIQDSTPERRYRRVPTTYLIKQNPCASIPRATLNFERK